eukprot:TRINITY_DN350_c0_g1_i1.p2 TRINITY_DN350_c0_g1~~TRINITY_DN350_c0_g1_i1.p2  ORF type:complete len:109 (-),score=40.70 TRINITY_DN350_c0_g1_i1:402-728(-)
MAIIRSEPKHRVIHRSPPFGLVVRNFRFGDWTTMLGLGAVGFPLGAVCTDHRFLRIPLGCAMAFIGSCAGFVIAYQSSSLRFMGFKENDKESKKFPERLGEVSLDTMQ